MTDAEIITRLCAQIDNADDVLEPREWRALADSLRARGLRPSELPALPEPKLRETAGKLHTARLRGLLKRGAAFDRKLAEYKSQGIGVVTLADAAYPGRLRKVPGAPPLFFYAGDLALTELPLLGFAGSRNPDALDIELTRLYVDRALKRGMGIVAGGARGIDREAVTEALANGGFAVEYVCDTLSRRVKDEQIAREIAQGRRVLLSAVNPDAGFTTGFAMQRNRFIYANALATIAIAAENGRGGTWAGAIDALRHGFTVYVPNDEREGSMELIRRGAVPISADWDAAVKEPGQSGQLSLLDL